MQSFKYFSLVIFIFLLVFIGCDNKTPENKAGNEQTENNNKLEKVIIKEDFHTERDQNDNVDSPAFWKGPNGEFWLLTTAKEGNAIFIFDARNGKLIKKFKAEDSFQRPNGIAAIDDLMFVVERDNHRVSAFSLPDLKPLALIGADELIKPYGVAIDFYEGHYHMYITDNYETADGEIPPAIELNHRVHYYVLNKTDKGLDFKHIKAFGDTTGTGVLYKVESILLDRKYGRLLIADEHDPENNIKIYSPAGVFLEKLIPNEYFKYEPEGIALFECPSDKSGYYICTDQDRNDNSFRVFNREDFSYIGSFNGEITKNTDGVALTQENLGSNYPNGMFYPVHDDGSVTAINWNKIAEALKLKKSCD